MSHKKLVLTIYLDNKAPKESKCQKKIEINSDQYNYYISTDSKPNSKNKRLKNTCQYWNTMSSEARLRFHLGEIAEGLKYSYELI